MAPDQATQEEQQVEGQCYCRGLTMASHHQAHRQLFPKEGREIIYSPLQQKQKEPKQEFSSSLKGGKQICLETVSVTWLKSVSDVTDGAVRMQGCAARWQRLC